MGQKLRPMSISTTTRKAGPFTGNGVQVSFPFAFKVFAVDDVLVVRGEIATAAEITLTRGVHYNVTLNSNQDTNPGGTVNWIGTPLSAAFTLVLGSKVSAVQPASFTNLGRFYPRVINDALDRLTILVQQLAEEVSRSVKVGFSGLVSPDELVSTITTAASTATAGAAAAGVAAADALTLLAEAQDAVAAANAAIAGVVLADGTVAMTAELELAGNATNPLGAVPVQQLESVVASASIALSAKLLGDGQSWSAQTRSSGTTYYNTTGRPIVFRVAVQGDPGVPSGARVSLDAQPDITICQTNVPAGVSGLSAGEIVIPTGASYKPTYFNTAAATSSELR